MAAKKTQRHEKRRGQRYIAFWLPEREAKAFDEAEAVLEERTGKGRRRSEHLRSMVKKFVAEVRLSQEFEQ